MIEFKFPSLGADMDEGMLVSWLVGPGDTIHKGDVIAEVETDKGLIEVESWQEGVVAELLVEPSRERIPVGTVLAFLEPIEGEPAPAEPDAAETPAGSPPPEAAPTEPHVTPPVRHLAHQLGVDLASITPAGDVITREEVHAAAKRKQVSEVTAPDGIKASPLARRAASELGVDLAGVESARSDGLVTVADVYSAAGVSEEDRAEPAREEPARAAAVAEEPSDRVEAMRRAISRSMSRSKREIPHYYLGTQIDLDRAIRWVDQENETRNLERRLLPATLLLRATALALREVPELNGHWEDDRFQASQAVHLGVAVALREGGLVAPAIHDADQLSLDEMMEALRDLVNRARTWRIRSSEMSDPTVTVTNLGDRGVETAFPVIIPPQVAIVGFGKVTDRPVAVDGMLAVHPVVNATLAGDHRVTDGHRGGLLLAALDRLLQEPDKL